MRTPTCLNLLRKFPNKERWLCARSGSQQYGNWIARVLSTDFPNLVKGVVLVAVGAKNFSPSLSEEITAIKDETKPEAVRLKALQVAFFTPGHDARPGSRAGTPTSRNHSVAQARWAALSYSGDLGDRDSCPDPEWATPHRERTGKQGQPPSRIAGYSMSRGASNYIEEHVVIEPVSATSVFQHPVHCPQSAGRRS